MDTLIDLEVFFYQNGGDEMLSSIDNQSHSIFDMFIDSLDSGGSDSEFLFVLFYSLCLDDSDYLPSIDLLFSLSLDSLSNIVFPDSL